MKNLRNILTILALAMFFFACSKDDGNPYDGNTSESFEFIQEDNEWTYECTRNGDNIKDTVTDKIISINGDTIYGSTYDRMLGSVSSWKWIIYDDYLEFSSGLKFYKNNSEGPKVVYNDGSTYQVLSLNDTVYVPAGPFSCIKIKIEGEVEGTFYISRKYGYIKGDVSSNGQQWIDILIDKNF